MRAELSNSVSLEDVVFPNPTELAVRVIPDSFHLKNKEISRAVVVSVGKRLRDGNPYKIREESDKVSVMY